LSINPHALEYYKDFGTPSLAKSMAIAKSIGVRRGLKGE